MRNPSAGRSNARDLVVFLIFLALCLGAGGLGAYWTSQGLGDWYASLRKPGWTPPKEVFGPVWTVLYVLMAAAAWLVWRTLGRKAARGPLLLFGFQLGLNAGWPALFFAQRNPGAACAEIIVLWAAILATLAVFARIQRTAGLLLAPYLVWVTFASALNFAIWQANR